MTSEMNERRSIDGRNDFRSTALTLLSSLPDSTAHQAWLVDEDLADWPLGGADLLQALTRWLRLPGRQLHLLARGYEGLAAAAPRFGAWRRDWGHVVTCCSPLDGEVPALPCLLVLPTACLQVLDRQHWRGTLAPGESAVRQAMVQIDAISQRSAPSWPQHLLGL